ncbi:hypothetical protein PHJA_002160200 [Phtheirospermum japonicum]|uniref:Core-2/I-branching beta-1,6-N-acetylglucosaminyltransferase family protein n=1 Tax=Phtheirospermum japonicum TaxID=374723 RepID=A0A830D1C9_9LAMI|nr:hypothetical protein PHJA_002160200 [Phtheirospermum japonicum]
MFLTKGGLPLSPLWERFFKGHKGHYSIYIHSLPSYRANFHPGSVFYKRQIPSQATRWGRVSICDAERRLLANALLDISNQRFVLLSESCIPLHNFTFIHNYITNSKYSFVNPFDDPGPHGRGRYNTSMSPVINATQWRKGSQWFEVDRSLALRIVGDTKFYPRFAKSCRPPCYADEHYFPTMLSIEVGNSLANRSVTWVDWSRGGPHPGTFGGADITRGFLKRVYGKTCSYNDRFSSVCYLFVCYLFGRKFSPSALEALFFIGPKFLGY